MRFVLAAGLALGLLNLTANAAAGEIGQGISVCGRLSQFTAATAVRAGEAIVGTRRLTLAPDTLYSAVGQNRMNFVVGNAICVNGAPGADGALVQYLAIGMPSPYCGHVLAYRLPTATAKGVLTLRDTGVATFDIAPGADLRDDLSAPHRCYALAIDAAGDAYVRSRVVRTVDRIVSRFQACGRITAYDKATPTAAGRVSIGTRTWPIEAAFVYTGDPAGKSTERTAVGSDMCLTGGLTAGGELAHFITSGFRDLTCGIVSAVVPATRTASGSVTFKAGPDADYARYVIDAGKALGTSVGADICIRVTVAPDGNAVVSAIAFPDRSVHLGSTTAVGATASPHPDVALPDLIDPAPAAASAPPAAAVRSASDPPFAASLLVALGVIALGSLLAIGLRRR
jgi:hypothetical protein